MIRIVRLGDPLHQVRRQFVEQAPRPVIAGRREVFAVPAGEATGRAGRVRESESREAIRHRL